MTRPLRRPIRTLEPCTAWPRVENIPLDQLIPSRLMTFTRHLQHSFKAMLQDKDPVALLLLALWYSKAGQFVWWIYQRAAVEGQSICLYLQRYHQETIEIQDLLPWKVNGEVGALHLDNYSPTDVLVDEIRGTKVIRKVTNYSSHEISNCISNCSGNERDQLSMTLVS
jgi:hypothetical protein